MPPVAKAGSGRQQQRCRTDDRPHFYPRTPFARPVIGAGHTPAVKGRCVRLNQCRAAARPIAVASADWLECRRRGTSCTASTIQRRVHRRHQRRPHRRAARTEADAFRKARPNRKRKIGNGLPGFFGGVPMHWMNDWPMPFPILVDSAKGATITDIDGNGLDDFCLGDTGSMFGHSPPPVARAIRRQAGRGLTYMLPSEDALAVGPLLQQTLRPAVLADRDDGDATPTASRCASPAPSPAGRKDPGLQRLLSRRGRRDVRAAGRRPAGQPAGAGRRIPRPHAEATDDRRVQRSRRARARARAMATSPASSPSRC